MASIDFNLSNNDSYNSSLKKSISCQYNLKKSQFEYLAKQFEEERRNLSKQLDKLGLADLQPLQFVNFEDELENLESAQKSSSKTYDIKDDSNDELSDIVSLQSITLTNDSLRLNKSQSSNILENSRIPSKIKSSKSSDSITSNFFSSKSEPKTIIQKNSKEVIRVKKTRRVKNEQKQSNLVKVTVENISESSDDDDLKSLLNASKRDQVPM
ncbi:unnamed protein product [Brachionus calyciflorus]|uniref:Uncharacterized protein n=1 Tax=Brachionus calyciflorus TaxID=104777 RepID=A0A813WJS1_9BILA|nr:unnamed protein product [Brachionus calyciflorus]